MTIRVEIPFHLRTLTHIDGREVSVEVAPPATIGSLLDAVEAKYPVLRGTIREHGSEKRRPFLRFYVCEEDWSNLPANTPLPDEILSGRDAFAIIGAIAGGKYGGGGVSAQDRVPSLHRLACDGGGVGVA